MSTGINESKTLIKHISCVCKLMVKNVIQIRRRITINVSASVKIQKNIVCAKKIIFRILLHVVAKIVNI